MLWRWDIATGDAEVVLDLKAVRHGWGDVDTVFDSSFRIAPDQSHATWIAGATPDAQLMIGDLNSGEIRVLDEYPLDHMCIEPTWALDGSAILVHKAEVWGPRESFERDTLDERKQPTIAEFVPLRWLSVTGEPVGAELELESGCNLRLYAAEDGSIHGIYQSLDVSNFYRVDTEGNIVETIATTELTGTADKVVGIVAVDPSGRYACVVDGYDEPTADDFYTYGYPMRFGTAVVDLKSGQAAGLASHPELLRSCLSAHADGYLALAEEPAIGPRTTLDIEYITYSGVVAWATTLPDEMGVAWHLTYFPGR